MLLEGLLTMLKGCTPLTNIVGQRIYPVVLPKNYSVPAVTFSVVAGKSDPALDSTYATTTLVDINCWSLNYHDAVYAQAALHQLLDFYKGTLSDGTVVMYTLGQDHPDQFEKDSSLYRCITTFEFVHN